MKWMCDPDDDTESDGTTLEENDMNKANLLGGMARIIREPSRKEMQEAMLHKLGAGHILNAESAESDNTSAAARSVKRAKPTPSNG